MRKTLILTVFLFSLSKAVAQKEKKIYYHQYNNILYIDDQPFTGSVFTFCRMQGNCPPDAKVKEIIVLPNLGIKNEHIDPENQTYAVFLQEYKTRHWVQVLVVKQKELGEGLKSVTLDKERKSVVINTTKQFPYSIKLLAD